MDNAATVSDGERAIWTISDLDGLLVQLTAGGGLRMERRGLVVIRPMKQVFNEAFEKINSGVEPSAPAIPAVIPEDFLTHKSSWRSAMTTCLILSVKDELGGADGDQVAYWNHELEAFDRAYAELNNPHPIAESEGFKFSDGKETPLVAEASANNQWDNIQAFIAVFQARLAGKWEWTKNFRCKYVELRVDMRDGGCIIRDREGVRISPAELAHQYSPPAPGSEGGQG